MRLDVRKKQTRFMDANVDLDGAIYDMLIEDYGQKAVVLHEFWSQDVLYSNGFIAAVKAGKRPTIELHSTDSHRYFHELEEYHHVIIADECYNVYFK